MNKTAIKNFAIWARNKLIAEIEYKAGLLGVRPEGILAPLPQSGNGAEYYDIGTKDPYVVTGEAVAQRRRFVEAIREKERGSDYQRAFQGIIEEVAYTWFNRLIAVRFMEVNDYLPSRIRVLSSSDGRHEPEIVQRPFDAELPYTEEERAQIAALKNDNRLDELFRLLFIKQCNALNEVLPCLFERVSDYTELLLNVSFTDKDGVVAHLVGDIPEADFNVSQLDEEGRATGQVEIIGWLYQYYNTEPKAKVFARPSNEKIQKEDIPAATQLFTPDWIVRYMVENSLGRLWLEGHPDCGLREGWRYYLDEAPQEPEVQAKLEAIRAGYRDLKPEDIKVLDPCMGSGHILVYAFDVLMQIYQSQGWSDREAAQSILRNNLFGLDIDKRAWQLAYFSVMMKARQYDKRFFSRNLQPQVYYTSSDPEGAAFGSLLTVEELGPMPVDPESLFELADYERRLNSWSYRYLLAQQYDVVVTNPPYMGSGGMNSVLSDFVKKHYPDSKSDLFSAFMEQADSLVKRFGFTSLITMESWMFLSSFEKLRLLINQTKTIINMVHMPYLGKGSTSLGINFGTAAVIMLKGTVDDYSTQYEYTVYYETNEDGVPFTFPTLNERWKTAKQSDFSKIPGSPIAYWVSKNYFKMFSYPPLRSIAFAGIGMRTGDNERFLRLWYEVPIKKMITDCINANDALVRGAKWIPYNKGGDFRRWYGNNEYVVNWEDDGYEIKENTKKVYPQLGDNLGWKISNEQYYFKEGITWTVISSKNTSFRRYYSGAIISNSGQAVVSDDRELNDYLTGLLNSKIVTDILSILSPTIGFESGYINKIPVIVSQIEKSAIVKMVNNCIHISRTDWDSFETSWDFQRHPLLRPVPTLADAYAAWEQECETRFNQLKANEEELNRIFIDIYGLQDELTPEVEDKDVTVRRADLGREVRSLLSYAVGCMFGRYSLDKDGLVYAGGNVDDVYRKPFLTDGHGNRIVFGGTAIILSNCYAYVKKDNQWIECSFPVNADNVIPITDEEYFKDDIVGLLCNWLKTVYGPDTLEENLRFIADALGCKGSTSREVIRNYFLKDFFKDHCKIYQKRPIYWLYDSGKQNGFKALVYMHRYNADTTGRVRADYLHRMEQVYESEISRMQETVDNSSNAREVAAAAKRKEKLVKQLKECKEYDERIAHLALARIEIDLDDGVNVNYEKVQTGRDGKNLGILAPRK